WEQPVAGVFDAVLADAPERLSNMRERIQADRTENATRFTSFKSKVATAIAKRDWYVSGGQAALWLAIAGFLVAAVVLIRIAVSGWRSQSPRWEDVVLVAIGICMAVNATVLF